MTQCTSGEMAADIRGNDSKDVHVSSADTNITNEMEVKNDGETSADYVPDGTGSNTGVTIEDVPDGTGCKTEASTDNVPNKANTSKMDISEGSGSSVKTDGSNSDGAMIEDPGVNKVQGANPASATDDASVAPKDNMDVSAGSAVKTDGSNSDGTMIEDPGVNKVQGENPASATDDASVMVTKDNKLDMSRIDMSWLNGNAEMAKLNIADLSFEQFQLMYYQHLFQNSAPDSKRTKSGAKPGAKKRLINETGEASNKMGKGLLTNDGSSSSDGLLATSVQKLGHSTGHSVMMVENDEPSTSGIQMATTSESDDENDRECYRCNEMFRSRLELTSHEKRAHASDWDSDLRCVTCAKKFSSKYYLNQHELIHEKGGAGNLPFACEHCDKRFLCKGTLETHVILLHTEERPHKCEECGASFKLKKILARHVETHSNDAPTYQCSQCDKSFSRRGSLTRHELIHTGLKPFQCKICQNSFNQKSSLTSHVMAAHSDERPFRCTKCDKSFCKRSHLTRHDAVHSGKRKYYECPECKKCFAEKYCLVQHEKTHASLGE